MDGAGDRGKVSVSSKDEEPSLALAVIVKPARVTGAIFVAMPVSQADFFKHAVETAMVTVESLFKGFLDFRDHFFGRLVFANVIVSPIEVIGIQLGFKDKVSDSMRANQVIGTADVGDEGRAFRGHIFLVNPHLLLGDELGPPDKMRDFVGVPSVINDHLHFDFVFLVAIMKLDVVIVVFESVKVMPNAATANSVHVPLLVTARLAGLRRENASEHLPDFVLSVDHLFLLLSYISS